MSKKRKVKKKRSWIIDIPISVCIFFIVIGIIIGNLFVLGSWYGWGKLIEKSETIPVAATFKSYKKYSSAKGSLDEIEIQFTDYEKIYMDGACFNVEVEEALDKLQSGDKMDLLLHPNSGDVWEIKSEETVILSFEDARTRMRSENIVFSVLGTIGYLCVAMGTVSLILQLIVRRKRKNKLQI